jgi:hypothetical protein
LLRSSRRVVWPLAAASLAAALLLIAVPASAWEFAHGTPRESVVPWVFHAKDGPDTEGLRTVKVWLNTDTCAGEEPPVAGPAEVQELPISAEHPRPRVIITTHQIEPAPAEVVGEVKPGEVAGACAGLGYSMPKRIKLKRPVRGTAFFDGSFSPPRRIPWPARSPSG